MPKAITEHCLSVTFVFERDAAGKPLKFACTALDVSKSANTEKQLKTAVERLDQLSFKNSHEFRGPIATILGLIQLISDDKRDWAHDYNHNIVLHLRKTVKKLDEVIKEFGELTYLDDNKK